MPQKTLISSFNSVESNNALTCDKKLQQKCFIFIFKIFIQDGRYIHKRILLKRKDLQDFFSDLAESLLIKLPDALKKYNMESVFQYYSKFIIEKPFHMSTTSEEEVFKIIQNIDISTIFLENI